MKNSARQTLLLLFPLLFSLLTPWEQANAQQADFTDNAGRKIHISKPFKRIISLYSAHTENLCFLGAADKLIGISRTDNYPAEILGRKKFSYREDPEKFIAMRPDLVLVRPMIERSHPQFIKKLGQAGITVISLQPSSVSEIFAYWKNLGLLVGREKEAIEMISAFKQGLKKIQTRLNSIPQSTRPRVYFESIHKKMKTFSPTSTAMYVLGQAGGINIATDAVQVRKTNIADYGKERILSHASEIDIFLAQHGRMNPVTLDMILTEPGFQAIKAVQNKKVFLVEEPLVSRPTFRLLEGIKQLNHLFFNWSQG
ncbi:ABC transporter substrate-binding protein [Desulfomarina sp.]